ncbi:hypothetical protein ACEWY4_001341 [Coilia grayii]|uniref:Murine leukemia virus integrase C-terminal domain-containing protein n=1 Tax=Coilia grayii TaxID=363190 RepID=A0ABD1KSR6_9TELE
MLPDDGTLGTAYAVVSDHAVVEAYCLPSNLSAQAAELVALSRACKVEVEIKEPEQALAEAQASAPAAEKRKWEGCKINDQGLWIHEASGKMVLPVRNALPQVFGDEGLLVLPGDWVLIRDFRRKHWHSPKFRAPYEVLLATPTAVRVTERDSWVHLTHCRVQPPAVCNHQSSTIRPHRRSPQRNPQRARVKPELLCFGAEEKKLMVCFPQCLVTGGAVFR